jgi:hypothetical protein
VSCVPIFVNGIASIFGVEVEVRTNTWISHFLYRNKVVHKLRKNTEVLTWHMISASELIKNLWPKAPQYSSVRIPHILCSAAF